MAGKSSGGSFNWAAFLQIAMQILAMILASLPATPASDEGKLRRKPPASRGKSKNQSTTSPKSDAA